MKVCKECGQSKPLSEYYKHKSTTDKLRPSCKQCIAAYSAKYRSENLDKCRERTKNWGSRNREKVRENHRKWYSQPENRTKAYEKWVKRRTLKKGLVHELSPHDSIKIRKRFGRRCAITGDTNIHLDHFIPLDTGHCGTYEGNLIPLSAEMNLSKARRNPFEWANTLTLEQKQNFDRVVEYLSQLNGLTVPEYREFVFWCFENKRRIEDITAEHRDSLALFLRQQRMAS